MNFAQAVDKSFSSYSRSLIIVFIVALGRREGFQLVLEALNGLSSQLEVDENPTSLMLRPADDDFDRRMSLCAIFQEIAQVCAIDLNGVFGATYLWTCVILNSPYWNSTGCCRRTCLTDDRKVSK